MEKLITIPIHYFLVIFVVAPGLSLLDFENSSYFTTTGQTKIRKHNDNELTKKLEMASLPVLHLLQTQLPG